ncbi:shikimate kinase [Anaeromicropila herbilytica]|uniref:Shikimate kinase n=1 Tax=Anaeromicropila herbilytica TaxID=2785025 RepID=A0A7R7EKE7_9FIRM|nr:shikimate kinase [Anaeromicropila herbilytica]BCN30388.1 shikimate kinase [Anaeromicropila herbilytica]
MKDNIILIGFMGTGKTTISHELSKLTGYKEIDTDQYVEEKEGLSIPDLFSKHGEEYFRDLETKALTDLQNINHIIISCGGGIVLRDKNVELLKCKGQIVLLTALPETILERVKENQDRPILRNNMNLPFIEELMNKRKDKYLSVADIIIETDNKDITAIAKEILSKVNFTLPSQFTTTNSQENLP